MENRNKTYSLTDTNNIRHWDVALVIGMVLGLAFVLASPGKALALGLKQNSIVEDSVIRLGDVFYGLSYNEDKVLGSAPRPGQDMVLNARVLMRIARAMDLQWRPTDLSEQIIIRRAATVISGDDITSSLREALRNKGVQGKFALYYDHNKPEIILPLDQPDSFDIQRIEFNPQRDSFKAEIIAPSAENPIQRVAIRGTIEQLIDVPVLRETISTGSTIRPSDLEIVEVPASQIKGEIILNPDDLLGMAPKRIVFAGKPVKSQDIEAPQIVERGEYVTLSYKSGPLQLTAQGKALENGAKGDMIRVVNNASSQTLEAVIIGEKQVVVTSF